MAEIRPYVVLQDWMFDLGLTASETIALAVIYGYTQDGKHLCYASYDYFARYCGVSRRRVMDRIQRLINAGLVERVECPGKVNAFRIKIEGCQNVTRVKTSPVTKRALRGDESSSLSPTPPIPDNNIIINNSLSACAHTDARTCEDGSEMTDPSGVPPTPQPPAPADDFRFLSSMEREACGFAGDRMAEAKRAKMAALLDRYRKTLAAEGLPMDNDQRRRFLDHWCAHRPGCGEIRAEGDPYFSVPAKARRWVEEDRRRSAAGNTSKFADATNDWRNGDF